MEKRRKLNVELIKFLIGSMLVVGVLMLLGSSLVNNRQYRKLYNDKALEIAKTVSDQVNGDFIEELCKEIDTEEFEQIQEKAVAADDEQPIIDWLKEKGMYQNYERINEYLHSIQADMNIEYLYIQMIQDHSSVYLFDPSSGYLTLGYKEELSERFDKLKGNERLEPTVSRTEFGWLSSAGEPVLSSDGEKCAVAFVDIDMTEIVRNTIRFTVLMVCLCILIILAAGMDISRKIKKRISRPIELLTEATHKFGNGEEGYDENNIVDLDIHTRDEIEELYHATQFMQKSIINYMDNLTRVTAEKERIGAELNVATQIQASMLPCIFPAFPDRDEMDIYATMTPAKEVGGDFYDFFMVDDRHMAIVMADVSGKGVPAALFMVIGKTLIKDHTQPGRDLGEVFTEVNNILCESNENGMFITAFEGVLDLVTGEFRYVNAGHEMPFVYRRETNTYEAYKIRAGFVLAGIEDIVYKEQKLQLNIGDKIFQYTDGVTDPASVYENAQKTKTVYHHGKGICPQGASRDYEFSVYIPSALNRDVSTIFAQWHGMPDRTLVSTPDGEVKKLTTEEFLELYDRMIFKKNVAHDKVPVLDKQGNPKKDKDGNVVYKAGKANGWLVEQGGYPPLAFGFSGGYFYIKANSDRKWLTDKTDRCNASAEKSQIMKPVTSKYKASTIAYKMPFAEFPKECWITFRIHIDWTVYGKETETIVKPGMLDVQMSYTEKGKQINRHIVDNEEILIGRNDEDGYYFKFGIYRVGNSTIPVCYNLAGYSEN